PYGRESCGRIQQIPDARRGAIDCEIPSTVAVEIRGQRPVGRESESGVRDALVRASKYIPYTVRRAEDRDVGPAVTIEIRGKRCVLTNAEANRLGRGIR